MQAEGQWDSGGSRARMSRGGVQESYGPRRCGGRGCVSLGAGGSENVRGAERFGHGRCWGPGQSSGRRPERARWESHSASWCHRPSQDRVEEWDLGRRSGRGGHMESSPGRPGQDRGPWLRENQRGGAGDTDTAEGEGGTGSRHPGSSRKAGHRGLQMASRVALSQQQGESQGRGPAVTPRDRSCGGGRGPAPPAGRMYTQVPTQSSVTHARQAGPELGWQRP